jgi:guanosine-3',5'-bis(diphosphate) 3'-pyrophosphohydrolase
MAEPVVRDPEIPLASTAEPAPRQRRGPRRSGTAATPRRTTRRAVDPALWDIEGMRTRLLETLREQHPQADLGVVERAFDLAVTAHANQVRASGEPYVTHPIASAQILSELLSDPVAAAAALLHDVPEDTEYSLADVEEGFGPEIAHLVDGVTKLSKFSTHTHEEQQAENIRKMFLAMADDIRVVLIKLADRLHNMRTLGYLRQEKQERIARQTMEIYAPLAERLGIWQIKWELEDLSFKVLEPEAYRDLAKLLDTRRRGRESYIERAIDVLRPRLEDSGIEAELQGRPKHIYSIWKKMQRKGAEFGEIYDVYAIRILVDEIRDCYAALGIVHALWRPIPGQFDDYIAVPKNNLYQSLHTAVIALDGKPLEIQIRTHAMHQVSEVGIAAHWRYKEGSKAERDYDAKLAWLRQLMEWQRDVSESDATEFVEGIKLDIFQDQVFVFTPRGDVKDLPAGATPLDFAYRIHTDIGHRTIGAKVNNRLVPLDYRLKNGDIVEIVTTKGEHGPSRDWLNIVRTSHAREKIRQWFKRKDRAENITHGRESLERELRRLARTSVQEVGLDKVLEVAKTYSHDTVDDFFAAIGYGAISSQQVVMRLGVLDDGQVSLPSIAPVQPARSGGVRVKGVGDLLVRFAKCCHPIPGDPIQGFITRGKGITVHLRSCPTVRNEREISRLIEVEWEAAPAQTYPIAIRVEAYDRTGLLSDITQVMAENKVNILAANVGVNPDHTAVVLMTIQVASVAQLAKVMARVEQLKDVLNVQRDLG